MSEFPGFHIMTIHVTDWRHFHTVTIHCPATCIVFTLSHFFLSLVGARNSCSLGLMVLYNNRMLKILAGDLIVYYINSDSKTKPTNGRRVLFSTPSPATVSGWHPTNLFSAVFEAMFNNLLWDQLINPVSTSNYVWRWEFKSSLFMFLPLAEARTSWTSSSSYRPIITDY